METFYYSITYTHIYICISFSLGTFHIPHDVCGAIKYCAIFIAILCIDSKKNVHWYTVY